MEAWPLFGLELRCRGVTLRPVREADLDDLAARLPDDHEHNPRAERFDWQSEREHRARVLVYQQYWRTMGTWSPTSWDLAFAVEHDGELVGVQSFEAEEFPRLRTVDSGSWLVPEVRGRGIGVAMRTAVLGLAFDRLGAVAAISSARTDNPASLGVSRRIGYRPNGVSLTNTPTGVAELTHLRLTAEQWRESGLGGEVTVHGWDGCAPWFGAA
jgi:RimJ/RimL family protein N-acetyltransferase